ncbi:NAD(P)-dependent dehydrogenase (short-subunit alcohol dehydrogenase family) [Herbihabitans rhizosphaerae]|uniref:NAD(P)-dependent dehydrogenase (Short-subunit alcohol dehydrogenase family) n=1 Tax=Herbihabitans rhizosphaerae TaxID=1872711 RepID=A0A4Q7L7C0_9PSEU|nr:SDR family oxidoreductase [Herbihabitans rhizosphaerae]RZS44531.1 NAD(P)-dependent dehydrogenase (short-subunit alcohol dehydrogenase family) [Herbihabitans rhizosphaerae]
MSERTTSRRALLGAAAAGTAGLAVTAGTAGATRATRGRFAGKVVLITGATSGIGEATAKAFAGEGAKVVFCGRRAHLGAKVEAEIRRAGGEATYIQADVRIPEQVRSFVDSGVARYGGLDIAFNNAGVEMRGKPVHEMAVADWDNIQSTNARGVFLSIKYEVPHMLRAGRGVIICTSSAGAERARPGNAAYVASKRAIQGIVRSAALDYGTKGIRVNAILPGTTDTPLVRPPGLPDDQWELFKKAWGPLNVHGLHRMAEPEEIATSILALADGFPFMTGSSVVVDGGSLAGSPMVFPPGFPPP